MDIRNLTLEELPSELRADLMGGDETPSKLTALDQAEAENPNTIVAIKEDGTYSMYTFAQPVKYIDEETNEIRFIDASNVF